MRTFYAGSAYARACAASGGTFCAPLLYTAAVCRPQRSRRLLLPTAAETSGCLRIYAQRCCWRKAWESRDDILRVISRELRRSRAADARDGVSDSGLRLDFSNAANPVAKLGTEGCRVLGAALQACDVMVDDVNIAHCNIVPATLPLIFGTGLELTKLNLQGNDGLGDAGLVVLADLLPQSVTCLSFKSTRCGSVGMIAMSKALPKLVHLQFLDCSHTGPSGSLPVSHAALECLGRALPRLPELRLTALRATIVRNRQRRSHLEL